MKTDYSILLSGKDPTELLRAWEGKTAALTGYTVSHSVMELSIYGSPFPYRLKILCGDVQHICGPTRWENAQLEYEKISPDEVVLRDRQAGFEVRAGIVAAEETSGL